MTDAEWEAVGDILMTADGGCVVCAGKLAKRMMERFPESSVGIMAAWAKSEGVAWAGFDE